MSDFLPVRAELPLDALEAFRLASFGIEYQPVYVVPQMDAECAWFPIPMFQKPGETWTFRAGHWVRTA